MPCKMHILAYGWPQEKQNQIADWLFSTENDANGKPKELAVSLAFQCRCSTEQGEASQNPVLWMRTECFMNAGTRLRLEQATGGQRNFKNWQKKG